MLEQGTTTIASPVVKSDTLPKTPPIGKEKEKEELKLTSSTSNLTKTPFMKEAKPKEVEWC
jgi:hypothetical protein